MPSSSRLKNKTAQQIEKGHFYWVGEFTGTFFSDKAEGGMFHGAGVKCPAWFDADFNNNKSKAGGYCINTDLDGDQAYLTWQLAGTPGPGDAVRGRSPTPAVPESQGLSGSNTFVGITQVNWADGTTSGYSIWNK